MARIFLGHRTEKGRVVYKRKKHYATIRDIARYMVPVANRYDSTTDPNYKNNLAPWRFVRQVAGQTENEIITRWANEESAPEVLWQKLSTAGPGRAENEWNRIYNLFIDILNSVAALSDFLGWIPFLGQVFQYEKAFWEALRQALHIEKKFVSVASKKEQKTLKP